jgi:hypothetical protein
MDNGEIRVDFDQASWGRAHCGAHVCNVEPSIGLCADLIGNGGEKAAVALLEFCPLGVCGIEVEGCVLLYAYLSLNQQEEATSHYSLTIQGWPKVMWVVATR